MRICPNSELLSKLMLLFSATPKTQVKVKGEEESSKRSRIKGTVVLRKKNVLDLTDVRASLFDRVQELFGRGVSIQLIGSVHGDPAPRLGKIAYLENWITTITPLTAGEVVFSVMFDWDESMGVPGALFIRNHHHSQFFLRTITLEHVPGQDTIHFVCNSWVYPAHCYKSPRIFSKKKVPEALPRSAHEQGYQLLLSSPSLAFGITSTCKLFLEPETILELDNFDSIQLPFAWSGRQPLRLSLTQTQKT